MIVDFHCHLFDFGKSVSQKTNKAKSKGIGKWISTALSPDEFQWHLTEDFLFVAGIHPYYLKNSEFNFDSYLEKIYNCSDKKFWGIGEIGLDVRNPNFEFQKKLFTKQLEIAVELKKPIILHSVKSYYEIYKIIKKIPIKTPLIFHGFNGNLEIVSLFEKSRTYFSVNNLILRKKNAPKILENAFCHHKLLFETDADSKKNNLTELNVIMEKVAVIINLPIQNLINYYDEICRELI